MKENKIDYNKVLKKYPWIISKKQKCIISPDSDGMLCGLLMSHFLDWKICGYYDGKVLLIDNDTKVEECVFLDIEIFRKDIRSIGHHMVNYRNDILPENWNNFDNSIQANNLRGFDFKNKFKEKYPFGTIHLLLGIVGTKIFIPITKKSIGYLLYTDGTFKNIFNYPDNSLSWLNFLNGNDQKNILYKIFYAKHTVMELMENLADIFIQLRSLNNGKRGADKITLTKNNKGEIEIVNIKNKNKTYSIKKESRDMNMKFLSLLSNITKWEFKSSHWQYDNFKLKRFKKGEIKATQGRYFELMEKNPLSLAITATDRIEYTLEISNKI